jgi:oligoribonuclease NrnB/cAMP/cGMP phosphodiesterase (DHH superfamily)
VRWRHHCRFCGNIFCSKCSENIIYGDQIDYKEEKRLRHCEKCHERIKKVITEEFNEYKHKSELYDVSENEFKFDIEDTTEVTSSVNLGI